MLLFVQYTAITIINLSVGINLKIIKELDTYVIHSALESDYILFFVLEYMQLIGDSKQDLC
jgi:hypothetical protein